MTIGVVGLIGVKFPPPPPFNYLFQAFHSSQLQLIPVKSSISKSFLRFAALLLTSRYFTLSHFVNIISAW